jgi:CubicO group peptidase (beta-lactamase class C family)
MVGGIRGTLFPVAIAFGLWPAAISAAAPVAGMPDVRHQDAALNRQLDALLAQKMRESHLPSAALAVVRDGQVIYERAMGVRDVARRLPATLNTIYPIGSATKPFTSMAIALAQDRGLLSLDDHPRAYLPYFHMYDPEADAKVNIRDLLSHRTGIMSANEFAAQSAEISRDGLVLAAMGARPTAPFRTKFQYSNVSYVTAGQILARVYRTEWEDVIRRNIFAPLGMHNSIASLNERTARRDYALGYVWDGGSSSWKLQPYTKTLNELAAAGMIGSSARDLTHWVAMLSNGGVYKGRRFVSAAAFSELTTPAMPIKAEYSYALGWARYALGPVSIVEHNGGSEGISALVSFAPREHVGFVFLANTSPNYMTSIGNAGQLIYPLVLNLPRSVKPIAAPVPDPTSAPLLSLSALLSRMIEAAGGERTMTGHRSAEWNGTRTYDSEGVVAQLRAIAAAPASRMEDERWSAAGQPVGEVRVYFDGEHGGQDVSFQGRGENDAAEDHKSRIAYSMHAPLELRSLCKSLGISGYDRVSQEAAYVLTCVPPAGDPVKYHISTRSARILRREFKDETDDYGDYRAVDGEIVPFVTVTQDSSGVTTTHVSHFRFNAPVPAGTFSHR